MNGNTALTLAGPPASLLEFRTKILDRVWPIESSISERTASLDSPNRAVGLG